MQFIDGQSLAALIGELRVLRDERRDGAAVTEAAIGTPWVTFGGWGNIPRDDDLARAIRGPPPVFRPRGRSGPTGGAGAWSTPIRRASCTATSSRATCCWTCAGSSGSPTSAWPRSPGDVGLTVTGELLGTLRYASPEQLLARRGIVDHRSDVYSLGVTLYELLSPRPPFEGRDRNAADPADRRRRARVPRPEPSIPAELETIVLKRSARRRPTATRRRRRWPTTCIVSSTDGRSSLVGRPLRSDCGPGRGGIRRSSGPAWWR